MGRVRRCELRRSRGCGGRCHDRRSRVGPRLYFQKVPEPKSVKNRVHLDVVVSVTQEWVDVQAAADRVVAAGGQILRISDDPNDRFILVGDPEGNEFCLVL